MPETSVDNDELFECRMCGDCCKGFGGTYVTPEDIETIAGFIGAPVQEFVVRYCRPSGSKYVLAQKDDGFCIFFDKLCTIHLVKPRMCRRWPFIENVVRDPGNWQIMASCCPGIKADAPSQKVVERIKEELAKESSG